MKLFKAQPYAYYHSKRYDKTPLYFKSHEEAEEYAELLKTNDYDLKVRIDEIKISDGTDIFEEATSLYEIHKDRLFYQNHRKSFLYCAKRLIAKYEPNNFQI
jgi:hypothetical protein